MKPEILPSREEIKLQNTSEMKALLEELMVKTKDFAGLRNELFEKFKKLEPSKERQGHYKRMISGEAEIVDTHLIGWLGGILNELIKKVEEIHQEREKGMIPRSLTLAVSNEELLPEEEKDYFSILDEVLKKEEVASLKKEEGGIKIFKFRTSLPRVMIEQRVNPKDPRLSSYIIEIQGDRE